MKKRILVTGAGGYIGSVLVPLLLTEGYEVRAIDRFFFGDLLPVDQGIEKIREDSRKIDPKHFQDVDGIVDLVALSNDPSGELFQQATWQINHESRVRTAKLAKEAGVKRYILPSSCSIYGFQEEGVIVDEESPINPLTTYAKANRKAEEEILATSDAKFCVTVLRQATVYGYSPRMRFDLAINGMTYGAWKTKKLPLMRDGRQWRPMLHVQDAARAICHVLKSDRSIVNGQIFNVGSDQNNYQIGQLAEIVISVLPGNVTIEWYGDPDHRSYRVSFKKIESIGYRAQKKAEDGAREVFEALESGRLEKSSRTITLEWYQELIKWHQIIKNVELYGGILDI